MTKVTIYKDADDVIKGFEVTGHAGFAKSGEDIVCAAVSILTTTAVNSVEKFTSDSFNVEVNERKGSMIFEFNDYPCETSRTLLDSMVLGLEMTSDEYGDYIRINIKEV